MYVGVSPILVFKKGGPGFHSAADLYHRVPLLPTGGRPVLQLLPIPQTGKVLLQRTCLFSAVRAALIFRELDSSVKPMLVLVCYLLAKSSLGRKVFV